MSERKNEQNFKNNNRVININYIYIRVYVYTYIKILKKRMGLNTSQFMRTIWECSFNIMIYITGQSDVTSTDPKKHLSHRFFESIRKNIPRDRVLFTRRRGRTASASLFPRRIHDIKEEETGLTETGK